MKIIKQAKKITIGNLGKIKPALFKGTIQALVADALKKNIEVYQPFEGRILFLFKKGPKILWVHRALNSKTNPVGVNIARNKNLAKIFLDKIGYPSPDGIVVKNIDELKKNINKIKFPVVVKPLGAAEGKGITLNVRNKKLLLNSFEFAKKFDERVLIENHLAGDYYRLTYIADGSYAATKNLPAYITGDGKRTAEQLIEDENMSLERAKKTGRLKKIKITDKTKRFLASEGFFIDSILPEGKKIPLCFSGYDGGEYIDVTDDVNPYFLRLAKDIAENLMLPIIGIDIITSDISKTLPRTKGAIIEINATFPDIQFHSNPTKGKPRNLAPKLIDYLFKSS